MVPTGRNIGRLGLKEENRILFTSLASQHIVTDAYIVNEEVSPVKRIPHLRYSTSMSQDSTQVDVRGSIGT